MKKLITGQFSLSLVMLLFATFLSAQTVRGVVTDADTGEPLIGANVSVQGFTVGTITDIDGSYTLDIPSGGETLVFSYAGYTDNSVAIAGQSTINVTLSAGALLDEVVVVGYGTQKTKEVTSAVTSIKAKDFNVGNVNTAAGLLQGKVAGLTISRSGGDPNGSVGIRLRGLSTIGAQTEPLVVIDGVPGGSLSNIDPKDIESIDVLKDGSAAAIYGTRGSSGVILVTTRKGEAGVQRVNYNGYVATEGISNIPDIATAEEFRAANGNDAGSTTDWYDLISQSGLAQSHNISLSGGTKQTAYRASFNYRNQTGVVKNTGFDQINGSLSLTQKALDDKLSVSVNLIATSKEADEGFSEAFRYATIANPTSAVFNEDGSYNQFSGFDVFNPVAMVDLNSRTSDVNELLANITASYNITDALKITGSYARQMKEETLAEYYPSNSRYRGGVARNGFARQGFVDEFNDLYEGTLQYVGESGNISYTVLAGTSFQQFNFHGLGIEAGGFLLDDPGVNQLSQAAELLSGQAGVFSYGNAYRLQAQFGRVTVNIDDTYFGSASIRREGSDRFGADNRYGIFPALSAGVDISKLSNINGVDNLKLRVGYGVTGNLPGQNNLFASIFNPGAQFFFNGGFVPSFGPTTNANPDLKWETKTEINVGVDFAFNDYRLRGALDVFNRKTEDLILFVAVPVPPNLAPNTWDNVASFSTNGIELAVNYDLIKGENFTYTPG
ncbi:MAG: SusC/RagA family TonB-linked outer membrane protein, partial [Saprospiraceae bacterium]|nr:SusC/RagA family TonB-linked outer membrane protein [Bacteroidia bacterium]NNE13987.1 SusC/RagA family TonB-linked outer membrane protein [Saprospiraceae bacterium]